MSLFFDSAPQGPSTKLPCRPCFPMLAATSLTFLKPRLKAAVRPLAARLFAHGVTANQVTLASLAGSVGLGGLLHANPSNTALFALLPLWLAVRTGCAALDGTLAVEFGQKSRLGGILNEAGDIISDVALFLPLACLAPFTVNAVVFFLILAGLSEFAGILGPRLGSDRRLDGPLGKADRSIVLGILGLAIAIFGGLPQGAENLLPLLDCALIVTIWNRLRFAIGAPAKAP